MNFPLPFFWIYTMKYIIWNSQEIIAYCYRCIVNYDIELLGLKINLFNLKQIDVCFYSTEGYVLFIISHILHINMFLKHFEYCTFIKIIETHIKP